MSAEVAAAVGRAHRREWARVFAATVQLTRDLDLAEECTQDAYAQALQSWVRTGIPDRPGAWLTSRAHEPVTVSRRIAAPAADIFRILADPRRHTEIDGSGMLRGVVSDGVVATVGEVFVMKMYYPPLGDYEMRNHVVEYDVDRRIGWEPEAGRGHPDAAPGSTAPGRWGHRWTYELTPDCPDATIVTETYDCSQVPEDERESMDSGRVWVNSMTETLGRLDVLCGRRRG